MWTEERSAIVKLLYGEDDADEEPAVPTSSAADALTKEIKLVAGAGEKYR